MGLVKKITFSGTFLGSGSWIGTRDLRVMSLMSLGGSASDDSRLVVGLVFGNLAQVRAG
jgi:hypothetical protein